MKNSLLKCPENCGFSGFVPDGKGMYAVVCSGGRIGGCNDVLDSEQLANLSLKSGEIFGAERGIVPLKIEPDTGARITHSWREIKSLDRRTGRLVDRYNISFEDSGDPWG